MMKYHLSTPKLPTLLFILCLLSPTTGFGFENCFHQAGKRFDIDAMLLKAIAQKESSLRPDSINRAKDGSEAVGLMQIHSQWFDRLERHSGITRKDLLTNACLNIAVGAWILSENFRTHGVSWNSVGAYMAGFAADKQDLRNRYAAKVRQYFYQFKDTRYR